MACEFTYDKDGKVVAITCSASWGIGVTTLHGEMAEAFGDTIYGFSSGRGNPHDFSPDRESCTPAEIAAWEEACAAWDAASPSAPQANTPVCPICLLSNPPEEGHDCRKTVPI